MSLNRGVVVPDDVPRIISDDLFEEVQKRFVLNKHKQNPAFGLRASCFAVNAKNLCRVFQEHPNLERFIIIMYVKTTVDIDAS